ncbi:MAG: fibronectin type III domain-containing protein, partial [Planctomycetota bacterium]
AATGPEGKLYRIAGGEVEEWYDSKEKNLLSLALGDGGDVYAGSGEKGFLYRVTEKGKARIVYDFRENEVRAIVPTGGGLLVAANAAKVKGAPPPKAPSPPSNAKPPAAKQAAPPPSKTPMDCAVYRLSDDGSIETAFASKGEFIWSLAALGDGSFLAATSERGRVYRARLPEAGAGAGALLLDGGADVLFDLEEAQALALGTEMGVLAYVGTGNGAAIYGMDARGAREAVYTSKAFDAKFVSTWGRIEWDSSGDVAVDLRSGATAEPDETWSDWAPVNPDDPKAGAPRSRYAQFRARLGGGESALRAVRVAYLVDNQRPDIATVSAGEGSGGRGTGQKKPKAPPAGKSGPPSHSTVVNVKWQAKDPDGDALAFRVYYRPEGEGDVRGETAWREMTKEPVTGDAFAWETRGLPDGRYVVRVVASDDRANPEARSLAAARESDPVLVDHTPPTIMDLRVAGGRVTGVARDAASRIAHLACSVDGHEWKLVAPADGLLDGPEEAFSFDLPDGLEAGPHAIAVQAADAGGNLAAARERFDVR